MIAGVLAPLALHDLRYGAAKDLANLTIIEGESRLPSDAVANALGHLIRAQHAGITSRYIGSHTDTWTPRVNAMYENPFSTEAIVAPRLKKRKLDEEDEVVYGLRARHII